MRKEKFRLMEQMTLAKEYLASKNSDNIPITEATLIHIPEQFF